MEREWGRRLGRGRQRQRRVMVRVDPAEPTPVTTGAEVVEMRGRPMPGWLRIAAAEVPADPSLPKWVAPGTAYARSLSAKR
jgi:hypothetical protein